MAKRNRQSTTIDPADLCRVVVLDKQTGRWTERCEWQPESKALHALAKKLCREGHEAYVVAQGREPLPSHTPLLEPPRSGVVHFTFEDGSTVDMDALTMLEDHNSQLRLVCRSLGDELKRTAEQLELALAALNDRTFDATEARKRISEAKLLETVELYRTRREAHPSEAVTDLEAYLADKVDRGTRRVHDYLVEARKRGLID